MSTISAGNTINTAFKVTADTTGNLTLAPNTGAKVILTAPLQYADGTTANTAASGGGGLTWQAVVTSNATVSSGNAYAVSTVSQPVVITLPASPGAGNTVQLTDYAATWGANNVTINRNGANIAGAAENVTLNTSGTSVALVYIDTARGWIAFNGFTQSPLATTYSISYLVVAGGAGGGGGSVGGGGGGAGGMLAASTSLSRGTTYTITVGAGGSGANSDTVKGLSGSNSLLGGLATAVGGGGGGAGGSSSAVKNGDSGGSGGGASRDAAGSGGAGTSGQGNAGGSTAGNSYASAGGGGGASAVGGNGSATGGGPNDAGPGGNGGNGASSSITGTAVTYAGGGGGSSFQNSGGSGGTGGGGNGYGGTTGAGNSGTSNLGGGGGGGRGATGGNGGSGVVVLSIPTAFYSGLSTGSPAVSTSGSNTILQFTSSGSYTA